MSLSGENRKAVVVLLALWPLAVGLGWVIGRLSDTHWPPAALAIAWLAVLYVFLKRFGDQRN